MRSAKANQNWRRLRLPAALLFLLSLGTTGRAKEFEIKGSDLEHMQKETKLTIDHLQYYHYTKKSIHNVDVEGLITSFMEELDYSRLFFLQSDKDDIALRFNRTLIEVYLRRGQLHPAFQIYKTYRRRALARLEWVFERLDGEFDFSTERTYVPDRTELDWPKDKAKADALWESRLTFDLLQEILNDEALERAKEKVVRRYRRTRRYIEELEPHDIQELFLTAFTKMYDPHSTFLSSDSLDDFSISMKNSLVGIGALLRDEDGYCVIQELISGGPADMSNQLHPGDKIIEVAQHKEPPVDVIDMKLRKIVDMIRGKKSTEVRLTVIPASATDPSERKVVKLKRDNIKLTENLARADIYQVLTSEGRSMPIGVIELPSFYGSGVGGNSDSSTTRDVEELVRKLKKEGIEGLVLDLSRNGGGLLSEAIDLTGLFIPKGPVVQVKDTTGQIRQDWDRNAKFVYEGPLALLVSRRSASASEIVAGALQNHSRAVIVGDSATHGKGTVQAIFELDRTLNSPRLRYRPKQKFGAIKITIQKFYLPNGYSTQNKGVRSDITLPSVNELLSIGESDLPNALVWDAIDPLTWDPQDTRTPESARIDLELLDHLRLLSDERQEELEEFSYLKRRIQWFKAKQDQTEYSLNLESRRIQRDLDKLFTEEMDLMREELDDNRFSRKKVILEVSREKEQEHQEKLRSSTLPNGKSKENAYYQKVFYYEAQQGGEIQEVWVENFDFEKLLKESKAIVEFLSLESPDGIEASAVDDLLHSLKTAETSDEFNVERAFSAHLGDIFTTESIDVLIPRFFLKLIELDPNVLLEGPSLNIPLRESLRILADWIQYENTTLPQKAVARHQARKQKGTESVGPGRSD